MEEILTLQQKLILVKMYGNFCFPFKKGRHPTTDAIKKWLPKKHQGHLRKALRKLRSLELVDIKKVGRAGDSYFLTELGAQLVKGWCESPSFIDSSKLRKKLEYLREKSN